MGKKPINDYIRDIRKKIDDIQRKFGVLSFIQRKELIEYAVKILREENGMRDSARIDAQLIAEQNGFVIFNSNFRETNLWREGRVIGMMNDCDEKRMFMGEKRAIVVESVVERGLNLMLRQMATIGHEIGHFCFDSRCDRNYYEKRPDKDVYPSLPSTIYIVEANAEHFKNALLIPKEKLEQFTTEFREHFSIETVWEDNTVIDYIHYAARYFNVPRHAVMERILALNAATLTEAPMIPLYDVYIDQYIDSIRDVLRDMGLSLSNVVSLHR